MARVAWWLLVFTAASVAVGLTLGALGAGWADPAFAAGAVAALLPAAWWAVVDLRAGRLGADVLAVLALAGTLAVGEYLAGAVIGVMLATGRVLELYAERRAGPRPERVAGPIADRDAVAGRRRAQTGRGRTSDRR
ncbi:hypothetical protein [Kutzneria sp. 744]|uniref:hypothetical protein n=1 Tax=Kutzneria sp. (strain 744) TaxID=345341 RepID=UPI0003EEC226|nr:heavy metal translocating P-type ATPase [Kutzneria sp. 744]